MVVNSRRILSHASRKRQTAKKEQNKTKHINNNIVNKRALLFDELSAFHLNH